MTITQTTSYSVKENGNAVLANLRVTDLVQFDGGATIRLNPQELTATGAISTDATLVALNHIATAILATRVAPVTGDVLVVINTSASGTAAHTVTLPEGVTWDGTNRVATLNAPDEAIVAIATSATRYRVLVNVGSVAFSNP